MSQREKISDRLDSVFSDKCSFVEQTKPGFEKWVEKKIGLSEFLKLTSENRKKLILKWAYGSEDLASSEACYSTDMYTYRKVLSTMTKEHWDAMEENRRLYLETNRDFTNRVGYYMDKYCKMKGESYGL